MAINRSESGSAAHTGDEGDQLDLRSAPTRLVAAAPLVERPGPSLSAIAVVTLAVVAGAVLGAIGWAATHPDNGSGATSVAAGGEGSTNEVTLQCVNGDVGGCNTLVAQTVADRCNGSGPVAVPGRVDDGTVRVTVEWITFADAADLASPFTVNGGFSEVVDCGSL